MRRKYKRKFINKCSEIVVNRMIEGMVCRKKLGNYKVQDVFVNMSRQNSVLC